MSHPHTLPDDPSLPQLGGAVDGATMQEVFDNALREYGTQRVTGCQVERIKYRPGRNCTVSYRLEIFDERRDRSYEQRVAGRFCTPGEAASRHARNRPRIAFATRCGTPTLLVPSMELFAWFLPNDPRLPALNGLCELVRRGGPALAEATGMMTGSASPLAEVRAELLQYVPESRACARFDVVQRDGQRGRLFAKLDRGDGGAATQRIMRALYASRAQREGRLRTPRPLLWQAATGLHWQQAVPGEPLLEQHGQCPPSLAARVGRAMAALHSTPVILSRHVAGDELAAGPQAWARALAEVEPGWAPVLKRILGRLAAGAEAVRHLPLATLHGDLHPRNILVDGTDLYLIDLDGARAGAAVLEVGAWVADNLYRARLNGISLDAVQEAAAHLLAAYTAESDQPVEGRQLGWAVSRALLDRAWRNVANLKLGRLEVIPSLLAIAAGIAESGDIERPLAAL